MSFLQKSAYELQVCLEYVSSFGQLLIPLGLIIGILFLCYVRGLYRVYFHPLSQFPGPTEAAKSDLWLFRQTKSGFPEDYFEQLHKRYNTRALRISPNELHITNTSLYKVLYRQSKPFPKHEAFYQGFLAKTPTLFTEVDAGKHKERRRLLNPMFSHAGVMQLEPLVRDKLQQVETKIERLSRIKPIDMNGALRLLTTNIIMEFSFCDTRGMMEENPDAFSSKFLDAFSFAIHNVSTFQHFPLARHLAKVMPISLVKSLSPNSGAMLELIQFAAESVSSWRSLPDTKRKQANYPIILDKLAQLSQWEIVSEGLDLLVAGSDTTACSLTVAMLEILSHPSIEAKLVKELDAAIPDKHDLPPMLELEKLEYISACVKEALRFTSAVPSRLPRVVPKDEPEPFIVDGKVVPPGTIVSISAHTMHTSFDIWGPDARSFNPDRWLGPEAKALEQYQCAFSKGLRMCIGQNLVPLEMTVILASLFRKYKFSFPEGFIPPKRVDVFTIEMEGGLELNVVPR